MRTEQIVVTIQRERYTTARLFAAAILSRLGVRLWPCPYCGTRDVTRWPWQDGSSHIRTVGCSMRAFQRRQR